MSLTMCTVTPGITGYTNGDGSPGTGRVRFQPSYPATGGGAIIVAAPVFGEVVGGFFSPPVEIVSAASVPALQYIVTEMITGCVYETYTIMPMGTTFDLTTGPRGGTPPPLYVLSSTVGLANGIASLDSGGDVPLSQLGNVLNVTAARAAAKGLLAMTEDLGMVPSQSGVTAGRLFVYPFVAGQSGTVNGIVAAYQTATAGNVNTNTFIGVYNAAGTTLIGQTADLASQLTTTTGGKVTAALGAGAFPLTVGVQYNAALLNNYTTTGPQWMGLRLFGTNSGPTARCLVSAGTMLTLPATLPALTPSGTNSMEAIEFSP
jgi:hypothetical protein